MTATLNSSGIRSAVLGGGDAVGPLVLGPVRALGAPRLVKVLAHQRGEAVVVAGEELGPTVPR